MATSWPEPERTQIEAAYREGSSNRRPIVWVELGPGESPVSVLDRRGGVDVLIGARVPADARIDALVRRAPPASTTPSRPASGPGDPRDDPEALAPAKARLQSGAWPVGYEGLVREAARGRPAEGPGPIARAEFLVIVGTGKGRGRAQEFLRALEARGVAVAPSASSGEEARADDLLADLLGAALVDARPELRAADAALDRFGHPAAADAALGERPPWPPASVAKLMADPNGAPMVETLLGQVAPDPEARAWLLESWSEGRRRVDGDLLAELAGAVDGRLAREPRFRAWLRGEWTAWTRQLYRRVARVAGGYRPS